MWSTVRTDHTLERALSSATRLRPLSGFCIPSTYRLKAVERGSVQWLQATMSFGCHHQHGGAKVPEKVRRELWGKLCSQKAIASVKN